MVSIILTINRRGIKFVASFNLNSLKMVIMKKHILICINVLLISVSFAQNNNNNVENNGSQILNVSSSSRSYGKSSASFVNPVKKPEGSVYLFDDWNNRTIIHTSDQQKFSLKNINLNIQFNRFESKISEDSIFSFNINNIDRFVIRDRRFKNYYYNTTNRIFEIIYESGKISLLKGFYIQFVKGSPNPMLNRYSDKNIKKESYFVKEGTSIRSIKLKKKDILKLLSPNQANTAQVFAKTNNLSFKNSTDVNRILTYAFSN